MTSLSDQKLDDQIALISQQLAKLKRIRRARKAAQASSLARQHAARDELTQQAYAAAGGAYGVVRDLARQYQLTTRQICQIAWNCDPHFASNHDPCTFEFERIWILPLTGFGAVGKWPAGTTAESLVQAGHLSTA